MPHWLVAWMLVGLACALRLTLALTHDPMLGVDGGAYLLGALEVQGIYISDVGFDRPPLAPGWLLVPFMHLLGMDVGYKVWTVLFSLFPMLPVYLLTRDLVNKSGALFALGFFSVDIMQMEMMVTGSLPLIGFSLIALAIWAMFKLTVDKWRWWVGLTLALSLGVLPYVNQTATGIAVIIIPVTLVAIWIYLKQQYHWMEAGPYQVNFVMYCGPMLLLAFLISLGAAPWYLSNAPGNSELRFPGPFLHLVSLGDAAIMQSVLGISVALLVTRDKPDFRMKTVAILLAVLSLLVLFLSYDEALINIFFRSRYFMGLFIYIGIAHLLCRNWPLPFKREIPLYASMFAVWALLLYGQFWVFERQAFYKDQILPETAALLRIAAEESPDQAIITNSYMMSHWVAALNQVESPNLWNLEPSPFYTQSDQQVRCIMGWIQGCDASEAKKELNAAFVLIDTRFPELIRVPEIYGAPASGWASLEDAPALRLLAHGETVQLWQIIGGEDG